jgi:hypothetical protein
MEFAMMREKVLNAIKLLYKNDGYLIDNDVHERTITAKLGQYLYHEFGNMYEVDCEYNRNIEDESKRKAIYSYEIENGIRSKTSEYIYPDIIIHKRGTNNENLLIIEAKKGGRRECDFKKDVMKLKKSTTAMWSNIEYCFGLYLELLPGNINEDFPFIEIWFKQGEEFHYSDISKY